VEVDDDDLFTNNVDDEIKGVAKKGRKFERGSKARDSRVPLDDNDLSTDNSDDDLQMPNSDGEGEIRLRFKPFRHEDINNLRSKVGMMFKTVVQLRMSVTKYSIKQGVEIKLLRNEKKMYEAVCVDSWNRYLYASVDSRAKGMVIVGDSHRSPLTMGEITLSINTEPQKHKPTAVQTRIKPTTR
jgi:hypothetical protein